MNDPNAQSLIKTYSALGKMCFIGLATCIGMLAIGIRKRSLFMITAGTGFMLMFGYGMLHTRRELIDIAERLIDER